MFQPGDCVTVNFGVAAQVATVKAVRDDAYERAARARNPQHGVYYHVEVLRHITRLHDLLKTRKC
jgi:hypothetical protein